MTRGVDLSEQRGVTLEFHRMSYGRPEGERPGTRGNGHPVYVTPPDYTRRHHMRIILSRRGVARYPSSNPTGVVR